MGAGGYGASAEELDALAKQIISVDGDTQATLRTVSNAVDGIASSWQGGAAQAFASLMGRFHEDASKLQEALRGIAEQMSGSAQTYIKQEEEATQLSTQISNRL
ncbi:hypothetical protein UK23_03325 [Lentzea aerocolonigenes]|uniref:ESAT-6-like protein n=1 Tax=Lentzea aerocolonigenes TaxID=68170 RepID=A0A0F0HEA0_LENAE|nr:WXG100 family type VII secretion target [Lentzea aerocolonigenes]KJK52647.1 hypothetical protein UK23_03325 [Lentzea aerocolonigenes]